MRPFTWRKKWEKVWDDVTTCSKSCNSQRKSLKQSRNNLEKERNICGNNDDDHDIVTNNNRVQTTHVISATTTTCVKDIENHNLDITSVLNMLMIKKDENFQTKDTRNEEEEIFIEQQEEDGDDTDEGGLDPKAAKKAAKKAMKAARRAKREGRLEAVKDKQKPCDLCSKQVNLLIRCQVDESKAWKMVCGRCWTVVSGGQVDGAASHPHYTYGGVWKNRLKR